MTKSSSLALVFFAAASFIGAMAGGAVAQVGTGASSGASSGGTDSVVAGPDNSDPAQNHGSSQNMGMAQIPAGIGERGTGQTQSTLERSGMEQSRSTRGMASDTPAGIGEKGTGQTQSTQERSMGDQSRSTQGTASLPPAE